MSDGDEHYNHDQGDEPPIINIHDPVWIGLSALW